MSASLREATHTDIARILELDRDLLREDSFPNDPFVDRLWPAQERKEYLESLLADPDRSRLQVADADAGLVGFLIGRVWPGGGISAAAGANLETMYVVPGHRNNGIGAALAQAFLAWAHDHGATRMTVTAYSGNVDAIRFYQRLGFDQRTTTLDRAVP